MKTNKIISAVAAISMLSSLSFTTVNAAHATNPTIHVYVTEAADIEEKNYYKVPDGYTPYMVSYSIEGVDLSDVVMLDGLAISYRLSDTDLSKVNEKTFAKSKTNGAVSGRDLNGIYADNTGSLQVVSNQQINFANTDGMDIVDYDTYPKGGAGETIKFVDTLWYVKTGESVTINYLSELIDGKTATSVISVNDGTAFDDEIKFAPASITLGKPSTVAVTGVSIKDKADFTLDLNGETTKTLEAVVAPTDATNKKVTWSSDNEKAATVVDGKVTAVGVGEAKITVTTDDGGFTDSVKVTVVAPETKVDRETIGAEGAYDGKTLIKLGKIFKNALSNSVIAVKNETTGETKTSSKTIAEILGGETVGETTIDVEITVGVLTDTPSDVFSFGLLN